VSIDGHRSDEFRPWIFKTTDLGATWSQITSGIPDGHPIYVVREDVKNPHLLFAGSEFGAFFTVDGGDSWAPLGVGLPTVAVHDLFIHAREGDLIAGTHGRSVWILDDYTALQQLDETVLNSDLHLFQQKTATKWLGISRGATRGHKLFIGRNPLTINQQPPGNSPPELQNSAAIHFWMGSGGSATLEILSFDGTMAVSHEVQGHGGLNRWFWDLRFQASAEEQAEFQAQMAELRERSGGALPAGFRMRGPQGTIAEAGSYLVRITADGRTVEGTLTLRDDPGVQGVLPSVR
jgi:hypothetical protein